MSDGAQVADLADAREKFEQEIDLNFVLAIAATIDEKQLRETAWKCRAEIESAFGKVDVMPAEFAKKRKISIANYFCNASGHSQEFPSFTHSNADIAMIALYAHLVRLCDLDPFNPEGPNNSTVKNHNGERVVFLKLEDARELEHSDGAGFYFRNPEYSPRQLTKC